MNKPNKKIMLILSIFLIFLVMSAASAADDDSVSTNDEVLAVEDAASEDTVSADTSDENTEVLADDSDAGSFQDLQNEINNATGNLILTRDYDVNPAMISNGIHINKDNFVLNGNGHKIDGKGLSRIFIIEGKNVTLKNITITGAYLENILKISESKNYIDTVYNGAAINWIGENANMVDITINNNFIFNNVLWKTDDGANVSYIIGNGAAIAFYGTNINIENSIISNNTILSIFNTESESNYAGSDRKMILGNGAGLFLANNINNLIVKESEFDNNDIKTSYNLNDVVGVGTCIYASGLSDNIILNGDFNNNNGLIATIAYFNNNVSNVKINGSFNNNVATQSSGLFRFYNAKNIDIDGIYKNNGLSSSSTSGHTGGIALFNGVSYDLNLKGTYSGISVYGGGLFLIYETHGNIFIDTNSNGISAAHGGVLYAISSISDCDLIFKGNYTNLGGYKGQILEFTGTVTNSNLTFDADCHSIDSTTFEAFSLGKVINSSLSFDGNYSNYYYSDDLMNPPSLFSANSVSYSDIKINGVYDIISGKSIFNFNSLTNTSCILDGKYSNNSVNCILNFGTLVNSTIDESGVDLYDDVPIDNMFLTVLTTDKMIYQGRDSVNIKVTLSNTNQTSYNGSAVIININNKNYTLTISEDNNGAITIDDLPSGNYNAIVTYMGKGQLTKASMNVTMIINREAKSFTDLKNIINNAEAGSEVTLDGSYYKYDPNIDGAKTGITISKSIIINGNGSVIDGSSLSRIFYLSGTNNFTFYNITLINGYADRGGAIYVHNKPKSISLNGTFTNNVASNAGGVIFFNTLNDNTVNITLDGNFILNSANNGGVITCNSPMTGNLILKGEYNQNYVSHDGGVLYMDRAVSGNILLDGKFTQNTANIDDGGVVCIKTAYTGDIKLYGEYTNNSANYAAVIIINDGVNTGNVTLNGTFTSNHAESGGNCVGGVARLMSSSGNVAFYGNYYYNSAIEGGIVAFGNSATANVIFNGTFIGQSSNRQGGSILSSQANLRNVVFDGVYKYNHASAQNGGIANFRNPLNGNVTFYGYYEGNYANRGGIISVNKAGNGVINLNGTFVENHATVIGGVAYIFDAESVNLSDEFTGNEAPAAAVIYIENTDNFVVDDAKFDRNNAFFGSCIVLNSADKSTLKDSQFVNNTAIIASGALINSENTNVDSCIFDNNSAKVKTAGLMSISNNIIVSNSQFINNSAISGSGVLLNGDDSKLSNCTIDSNKAVLAAGILLTGDDVSIEDSRFNNNSAELGGGLQIEGNNAKVTNCNFTNNTADMFASAVMIFGDNAILKDCHVEGSSAPDGAAILVEGNCANVTGCTFKNNVATDNNGSMLTVNGNGTTLEKVNVTGNSGKGITLNGDNATIKDNILADNDGTAITVNGEGAKVDGTQISNNNGTAVVINGDGATFSDNTVTGNNGTAMTVNGNGAVIEKTNLTGNDGEGIVINGNGSTFTGNTISGNNGTAMTVNGNDAVLEKTNVTGNNGAGIVINGNGTQATNNTVSGNNGTALTVNGNGAEIAETEISNNDGDGVIVNGDGAKFSDNTVTGNNGTAMTVNGNDAVLEKTNVTGNDGDGIIINGNGTQVTNNTVSGNNGTGVVLNGNDVNMTENNIGNNSNSTADIVIGGNSNMNDPEKIKEIEEENTVKEVLKDMVFELEISPDIIHVDENLTITIHIGDNKGKLKIIINGTTTYEGSVNDAGNYTYIHNQLPVGEYEVVVIATPVSEGYISYDAKKYNVTLNVQNWNFTELQQIIDNAIAANTTADLGNHTFVCEEGEKAIKINDTVKINGEGAVIDANNNNGAFNITADNVTLNNMTIENVKDGVAINTVGNGTKISDIALTNNTGAGIKVEGNNTSIEGITADNHTGDVISVTGDNASVSDVEVNSGEGTGVEITGNDAKVSNIDLTDHAGEGIVITGDNTTVEAVNSINATSPVLNITGNNSNIKDIGIVNQTGNGIIVTGDNNNLTDATINGGEGTGITVKGNDNKVSDVTGNEHDGTLVSIDGDKNTASDVTANAGNGTVVDIKGGANNTATGINTTDNHTGDSLVDNGKDTKKSGVNPGNPDTAFDLSGANADPAVFTIKLPSDATGNFTVSVGGKDYTVPVVNGTATISVPGLASGNTPVVVSYSGDDQYSPIFKTASIDVPVKPTPQPPAGKLPTVLTAKTKITFKKSKNKVISATLLSNGVKVTGVKVFFKLDKKTAKALKVKAKGKKGKKAKKLLKQLKKGTYGVVTKNGVAKLSLSKKLFKAKKLKKGKVTASFKGDNKYTASNKVITMVIK